jgi:hypothetical protein
MPKASTSKKTKKIKSASLSKKPLLVLVAVLFIAIGIAAVIQTSAYAGYTKICNSNGSYAPIKVYDKDTPTTDKQTLWWDQCTSGGWYNGNDDLRVDVNPEGHGLDVGSYKLGVIGSATGYGDCHKNSENNASNPPQADAVRYRNYHGLSC